MSQELGTDEVRLRIVQAINTGVHHGLQPEVLDSVARCAQAAVETVARQALSDTEEPS